MRIPSRLLSYAQAKLCFWVGEDPGYEGFEVVVKFKVAVKKPFCAVKFAHFTSGHIHESCIKPTEVLFLHQKWCAIFQFKQLS